MNHSAGSYFRDANPKTDRIKPFKRQTVKGRSQPLGDLQGRRAGMQRLQSTVVANWTPAIGQ